MTMSAPKEHEEKTHVTKCLFFLPFFCPFCVFICYPKHKKVRDLVRFAAFRLPFFFESQVSLPLLMSIIAGEKQQNKDDKTTKKKKKRHTPSPLYIGFSVSSSFLCVCVKTKKKDDDDDEEAFIII